MRKSADLKANDLAQLLDVSPETVWRWENEKAEIPRAVAFAPREGGVVRASCVSNSESS